MKRFRIIALRVLQGCTPHIRKALKENVTYFLCNDYEDKYDNKRKWIGINKKEGNEDGVLPPEFFAIPETPDTKKQQESKPTVSISAIVGKNGDGKSSLVELMLRIIYNFGVVAYNLPYSQIKDIEAILYYDIDGKLYFIKCSERNLEASFAKLNEKEDLKRHTQNFFYTIVANYSHYSYNSRNFKEEVQIGNDCWINEVFNEDSNYQQPLVLNPMRIDGNIDVNREEDLCYQRLMALYTDLGNTDNARMVNDNKIVKGFAFNIEEKSRLETIMLRQYFQSTWKSTALMKYSVFLKDYLSNSNVLGSKSLKYDFNRQVEFWTHCSQYLEKYEDLFQLAKMEIEDFYIDNNINYVENEESDLKQYLKEAIEKFAAFVDRKEDEKEKLLKSLKAVSSNINKLTGLQFQRLVLIIEICELWSKWFNEENYFSNAINQYVNNNGKNEECKAKLNVIYETLSILPHFGYQEFFDVSLRYFCLFDQIDGSEYYDRLEKCFNDLFIDKERKHIKKTYDTLSLRQTINYLLYDSFKTGKTKDEQIKKSFRYDNYVTFEKLLKFVKDAKEKCPEETIALMPPPIFKGEILIGEGKDEDKPEFKMSELSSGELQMLLSINTYIYHLRNIDNLQNASDKVKYPYVNMILEEVELYFHPEFQRQYVYQMLRQIEQVKLENIKAINIILVTHSPIVLTDIPKNNVLFLKDGKPVFVMQENTFGANIHALLQNGFFLEGVPMGEFANKKINKMFERLHSGEYTTDLLDEIKLVSEPLLKTQLYQLYSLNKLPFGKYEHLLKRIIHLEEYIKKIEEEKINGGN